MCQLARRRTLEIIANVAEPEDFFNPIPFFHCEVSAIALPETQGVFL